MKAVYKGTKKLKETSLLRIGDAYDCRVETGYHRGKAILRLILDDGQCFCYASIQILMREWKLTSRDDDIINIPTLRERDSRVEELWNRLGDVPMNPETECMEAPFLHFPAGTNREDIWKWFDERHSRGVYYLLYGRDR